MKGLVFKVFENHVIEHVGEDMLDDLLDDPELSTGGAYTAVGNYPTSDMLRMVTLLSERTGAPVGQLVETFGYDLFGVLADGHKDIMAQFDSCIDMLAGIESVIHRDVRKLYSDAELPRFDIEARDGDRHLRLLYQSSRPFADLAHGLIRGALAHYELVEHATITREDLADDGTKTRFDISISPAGRQ